MLAAPGVVFVEGNACSKDGVCGSATSGYEKINQKGLGMDHMLEAQVTCRAFSHQGLETLARKHSLVGEWYTQPQLADTA